MPKNNYWIRSGSYVFLQRISALIFGFGSYVLMVRCYEPKIFGVWTLFVLITSIIEMSRSAFIQNAFVKFYAQTDVDRVALTKASLYLNFISNMIFVILMIILIPVLQSFWHTDAIGPLILWYCITSTILVPFTQLNYIEQASHSFKGIFWSTLVRQGLFFMVVTIAYLIWGKNIPLSLSAFAALQAVCALAGLAVAWKMSAGFVPREVMANLFKVDWAEVRRIFKFGKYILGVGLTSSIGKSTDQFLLGNVDTAIAATYNAAVRIINFIEVPTYTISNVVYPKIAEKAHLEGKMGVGQMYEKSVAYMVAIIIPVVAGVALLPDLALLITTGSEEYAKSAPVLRLLVMSAILFPFNVQVGSAFEVIGKPQVSFGINFASNILNLLLNLYMVPTYGAIGAAWTVIFTGLSIFVVSQVMLFVEMRVNLIRILMSIPAAYGVLYLEVMHKLKRK
jgi:lipopolysaccharide exporter